MAFHTWGCRSKFLEVQEEIVKNQRFGMRKKKRKTLVGRASDNLLGL